MEALLPRRSLEAAGILFYLMVAGAILAETLLWPELVTKYAFWEQLFLVAISLDAGHLVMTNLLILGDQESRREFPWLSWLLLNAAVFLFLFYYLRTPLTGRWFWGFYRTLVMIHSVQQALGIAMLSAAEADRGKFAPDLKRFAYWAKRAMIAQALLMLLLSDRAGPAGFIAPGLAVVTILFGVLAVRVFRASSSKRDALPPLMSLGRACVYVSNGSLLLSHLICRAAHAIEYVFIYGRSSRGQNGALTRAFWLAIAVAGGFQALWIFREAGSQGFVLVSPTTRRVLSSLVFTVTMTHTVQDWYVFNYSKAMAARYRARISARYA